MALLLLDRHDVLESIRQSSSLHDAFLRVAKLPAAGGYKTADNADHAADVRPVVRCADCKWFQINMRQDGYLPKGVPECECRHWCGSCDPTDFCSYGALMDKDGDGDV